MKNKINKILLIISSVLVVSILFLAILGSIERIGYLSEFKLDKSLSKKNAYFYNFRIKYYSKIFRNSDIYGVYFNVPKTININNNKMSLKNIKMDKKGSPYGTFISSKELKYDDKVENIKYKLKIKLVLLILFLLSLIYIISAHGNYILSVLDKYMNKLSDKYAINTYKSYNIMEYKVFGKYRLTSILFFIYLILLAIFVYSFLYSCDIRRDDWQFTSTYDYYNIFDFIGKFWQRGRHIADMLLSISMRPFGRIFVSLGADPFTTQKISIAFFETIYFYILSAIVSYYIFIINNKKEYKLIFLMISLFTLNFLILEKNSPALSSNAYYSLYIGSAGISLVIWLPIFYFFIYEKEILILNNKIHNYILFTFLIYFATFVHEATSLFIAGISFFAFIFFIIRKKYNIGVLYSTFLFMIYTVISFLLTAIPAGSRGKDYIERKIYGSNIIDIFENMYIYFDTYNNMFDNIIFICSIVILVLFIIKFIKNSKIDKYDYFISSILLVSILGIIGFYSIKIRTIWFEKVMLFSVVSLLLIKNINSKSLTLSLISLFCTLFLIFLMSFSALVKHNDYYQSYFITKRSDKFLIEKFVEADKLGKKEIILTPEDYKKDRILRNQGRLSSNPNGFPNRSISKWMQQYGYTKNYIELIYTNK